MKQQLLYFTEQLDGFEIKDLDDNFHLYLKQTEYFKLFKTQKENRHCFSFKNNDGICSVNTSYYVGIDWLEQSEVSVCVESKLNNEEEIDFLNMLLSAVEESENLNQLEGLFQVDFDVPWIEIPKSKDRLSPFIIVQFLSLVRNIVRKGLKKSYYAVTENLDSLVKGKILVSKQIKQNVFRQKFTNTICQYQEHGVDHWENQHLKTVLLFIQSYLENHESFFSKEQFIQLNETLSFCLPAFQHISIPTIHKKTHHPVKNVFYKEYPTAIKLGETILKRFSYNITKAMDNETCLVPPFWIDMSKLFELYVFRELKCIFPEKESVTYHDKYRGGKETDILIKAKEYECVVDCKYKPRYENNDPSLEDKRQLAGYTRMKSVYDKLGMKYDQIVKGLIIYSHQSQNNYIDKETLFTREIAEYVGFYKLGIRLPEI